jgi:uncharacterized membrane protein
MGAVMTYIIALAYAAGSLVCHQIPERSFHIGGAQLPVCARCTGLYLGAAAGALFWLALSRRRLTIPRARTVLAIAAIPTVMTLVLAWAGWWDASNAVRAVTALPLGISGGAIVLAGVSGNLR